MRATGILSVVAATIIGFAASSRVCSAQAPSYQGVWTGLTISSAGTGSATVEADLVQNGVNLSGTARITQGMEFYTGTVTGTIGTPTKVNINFGTFGNMTAALDISGGTVVGNYSLTSGTDPAIGSMALTLESGVKTPNIAGIYFGTALTSATGAAPESSLVFALQNGDNISFYTFWGGVYIFDGTGTIIGNKITFQVTQTNSIGGAARVMYGTATVNGGVISGITTVSAVSGSPTIGAFTVKYGSPIL